MNRASKRGGGMVSLRTVCAAMAIVMAAGTASAQYSTPRKKNAPAAAAPSETVATAAQKILTDLAEIGDLSKAKSEADTLLKKVVADKGAPGDLIAAARTRRIVRLIDAGMKGETVPSDKPASASKDSSVKEVRDRTAFMIASPAFADSLAWLYDAKRDSGPGVFRVVGDLITAKAPFENYPELAAAIAVVHDQTNPRKQEWSLDHVGVMKHFLGGSFRPFAPGKMPAVLLTHVVDMVCGGGEIEWAARQYGYQPAVGKRYFDVRYDNMHFEHGQKKAIEGHPYTLQNIKKLGGVCVEQAYFAEQIGKSMGIPAVTVVGRGDDVGHAWVGYLRQQGKSYWWDTTEGRYKDYKGEAASVRDPQTGESISDGELSMVAERASYDGQSVRLCLALADASTVVESTPEALELCERSVNACPYVPAAWDRIAELAKKESFSPADLEKWGGAAVTLCGTKYPDFALKFLTPIVAAMKNPLERAPAWAWIRTKLVDSQRNRTYFRYDLAVKLRMLEADAMRDGGDLGRAWNLYRDCIQQYGKETPAVQEAADRCDRMLADGGKGPGDAAEFWKWAWSKTDEPDDMSAEFARGSNWAVFGMRYAMALDRAGDRSKAESVRKKIMPKQK